MQDLYFLTRLHGKKESLICEWQYTSRVASTSGDVISWSICILQTSASLTLAGNPRTVLKSPVIEVIRPAEVPLKARVPQCCSVALGFCVSQNIIFSNTLFCQHKKRLHNLTTFATNCAWVGPSLCQHHNVNTTVMGRGTTTTTSASHPPACFTWRTVY